MNKPLPLSMLRMIEQVADALPAFPSLRQVFANTFSNTFETTLRPQPDGSVFVITGDIPAMWLRDSAAQVKPYIALAAKDDQIADLLAGVVRRQTACVLLDPYANAFNEAPNGHCHNKDQTEMSAWIWERKYELDSLCAPLNLAHDVWKATQRTDHLDENFVKAAALIVQTIIAEQDHESSPYAFQRFNCPVTDTLSHHGRGSPVAHTGMSWSGFRPSDDSCTYHYLVPSNMMAVVALEKLAALPLRESTLQANAKILASDLRAGIEKYGKVQTHSYGEIYAYEVDGLGNHNLMDDANVPSLLAMPYMGYCTAHDKTYQATRAFVVSEENPYFFKGSAASGIGSPHTPENYIWPISLCMQGLTSTTRDEKLQLLETLLRTDAATGLMHESFHKNDPTQFTRPWFAWANSLFAEFVMDLAKS